MGEVGEGVEGLSLLEQLSKGKAGKSEHEDVDDHACVCDHVESITHTRTPLTRYDRGRLQ